MVKEIAIMEQRYRAMLAFLADVRGVGEVVAQFGVSRQPVHASICRWKYYVLFGRRYCTNERGRNRRPRQMPGQHTGAGFFPNEKQGSDRVGQKNDKSRSPPRISEALQNSLRFRPWRFLR